jgi:hypothetical protein
METINFLKVPSEQELHNTSTIYLNKYLHTKQFFEVISLPQKLS